MSIPASQLDSHATAIPSDLGVAGDKKVVGRSPTQLAVARFRKDKLSMISFAVVALYLLAAASAPFLQKFGVLNAYDLNQNELDVDLGGIPKGSWGGISGDHLLGVEPGLGRDVLSRLTLGITYSLAIALSAAILTVAIGAVLGIVAGFSRGLTDSAVGRLVDLTLSFPSTLMLLALSGPAVLMLQDDLHVGNRDLANGLYVVLILAAFGWPPICRVVRGQVLSLREREFVDAAVLLGASRSRLYFKEILPNLWAPLLVYFTLTMPAYISAEAAFNYLGVGVKPPTPTLGNILQNSINYSIGDPVFFFAPAILLAIIVVSFNLLGDGIRDALDPRSEH